MCTCAFLRVHTHHFTSFSSLSSCTARWTIGPRTAYSIRLTLGFMVSKVNTLPGQEPPLTGGWDIVAKSHSGLISGRWRKFEKCQQRETGSEQKTKRISCYQSLSRARCSSGVYFLPFLGAPTDTPQPCVFIFPPVLPRLRPLLLVVGWISSPASSLVSARQVTPLRTARKMSCSYELRTTSQPPYRGFVLHTSAPKLIAQQRSVILTSFSLHCWNRN